MVVTENAGGVQISIAGKPCHQGQAQVKLERIPAIRRADKPAFADAHDFTGHLLLPLIIADVFNNGIAVDDIEILVRPGQMACIADNSLNLRVMSFDLTYVILRQIERSQVMFPAVGINKLQPPLPGWIDFGANIENARVLIRLEGTIKQAQLPPSTHFGQTCKPTHVPLTLDSYLLQEFHDATADRFRPCDTPLWHEKRQFGNSCNEILFILSEQDIS